jgi:hypothetical protein
MPIIYRKTAKGVAEIETRAHRLVPRLRSALIVVDGKRPDSELAAMLPQGAETLAQLAEQGFIEVASERSAPRAAPTPAPAAAPAAPSALSAPSAPSAPALKASAAEADFDAMRRYVLRSFNDLVGPAGESMAIRIEKARSMAELRALLQPAVQIVGTVQGKVAAQSFIAKVENI